MGQGKPVLQGGENTAWYIHRQETKYMMKQAIELMRKIIECHVIYISQRLKSGGGKLSTDSGMQTFSETGVRTIGWVIHSWS